VPFGTPLDLVEPDFVAPAILELRGARRGWFAIAAALPSVRPMLSISWAILTASIADRSPGRNKQFCSIVQASRPVWLA